MRVASESRPTYQDNGALWISLNGSIATSIASRCESQRLTTSPSATRPRCPAVRSSAISKRSAAFPITGCWCIVEHGDFAGYWQSQQRNQRRPGLPGPAASSVSASITVTNPPASPASAGERTSQRHAAQKHRRSHSARFAKSPASTGQRGVGETYVVPDDFEIGGFQGAVFHKMIAPRDHHFQFSLRASASAIAATCDRHDKNFADLFNNVSCNLRSAAQASGGGHQLRARQIDLSGIRP